MSKKKRTKLILEGRYVAEVDVEILEEPEGWSPYLSLEDAYRLDDVREALRRGDIKTAARKSTRVQPHTCRCVRPHNPRSGRRPTRYAACPRLSLVGRRRGFRRQTRHSGISMTTRTFGGQPRTEVGLRQDLVAIGVTPGMTLLVHSSLSSIGLGGRWRSDRGACASCRCSETRAPWSCRPRRLIAPIPRRGRVRESRSPGWPRYVNISRSSISGPRRLPGAQFARPSVRGRERCGATIRWSRSVREVSPHRPSPANTPWRSRKVRAARSRSSTTSTAGCCFSGSGSIGARPCISPSRCSTDGGSRRCDSRRWKTGSAWWKEVPNVGDDNDTHFPAIGHKFASAGGVRQGTIGDADRCCFDAWPWSTSP